MAARSSAVVLSGIVVDAVVANDWLYLLTTDGSLHSFSRSKSGWLEQATWDVTPDSAIAPVSILAIEDHVALWEPRRRGLVQHPRGEEVFVSPLGTTDPGAYVGTHDVTRQPRGHGRIHRWGPDGFLFETRDIVQQQATGTVDAAIVAVTPSMALDTVLRFRAPAYSKFRGGVRLCCGASLFYSAHPQWDSNASSDVAFLDNRTGSLRMWRNGEGWGEPSVTVQIPWERRVLRDEDMVEYGVRQGVFLSSLDRWGQRARRAQHRNDIERLRTEFPDSTPVVSELLISESGDALIRSFDPEAWPFGGGREWLRFRADDREPVQMECLPHVTFRFRGDSALVGWFLPGPRTAIDWVRLAKVGPPAPERCQAP